MNLFYELFLNIGLNQSFANILSFFIYEVLYLSLILSIGITFFSFIRIKYLDKKFTDKIENKPTYLIYLAMALLGVISPFCSCSTIPVFVSFATLGVPTGALFVYLITSPMVQETSFILLLTEFGFIIALIYVLLGIFIGITVGIILSKAKEYDLFNEKIFEQRNNSTCCTPNKKMTLMSPNKKIKKVSTFQKALKETKKIMKNTFKYIVLGIAIGAIIHGLIPSELIESILGTNNPFAPILATLVGIPIYADDVALIPVAKSLVDSGAGLGTALSFVMSSAVVSIPSFVMLGAVLKKKTLIKLAIALSICIIIMGYIFNYITLFL